jgi:heptosyltransferase-2
MKIAIFCPNWVGDLVMATPALRALRQRFADDTLVGIMRPYVADVVDGLKLFDDLLFHDPFSAGKEARGWRFARSLRQQRFDTAILLPNSFRSAWWGRISGASRRVGLDRGGRRWLLTDPVPATDRKQPHPVIDEYRRIAESLGCTDVSRQLELATTHADERRWRAFWKAHRNTPGKGTICLNPGGAFGAAKHWPAESFANVARRIAGELDKRVLVLCGPSERETAREIVREARHPGVVSLADHFPSIGLTKAAIRHSELLLTTDSGPRHFAAAFQVPVVTLFGPTHIAWSETYYERGLHLQLDLECGPCQQRVCPLQHHRCMRNLNPDWVFRAVTALLERYPAKAA